jgi:hypothetical protein
MKRIFAQLSSHIWFGILTITGVVIASFGIYIPWYGIYGDDWPYLYLYHLLGAGEYGNFVMMDRPFSAWVYWLYTPLVGEHFFGYHLILLGLRLVVALLFWWLIRLIWKDKPWQALWVAVLYAIYPSFKQQPLPLEYVLHFTILSLFLLSLIIMMVSIKRGKAFSWLTLLGMICSAGIFSIEYFVGLEMARPLIIWISLEQPVSKKKVVEVLKYWLPYGLVLIAFYYWRIFVFQFKTYQPVLLSKVSGSPLKGLVDLGWRIFQDLVTVVFRVWGQAFEIVNSYPVIFLQSAIILVGGLVVFGLFQWAKNRCQDGQKTTSENWGARVAAGGVVLMLLAGIPFWVTNISLWLTFPWDRTTLPFIPGAALFIVGMVELLFQSRYRNLVLAALVGLSFAIHYQNVLSYKDEWKDAREMLWELTWRAPMIKPGTSLVTDVMPVVYYGDNTLSPAINWTYAPNFHQAQIPYRLFDLNIRQDSPVFSNLGRHQTIEHNYRSFLFTGSTDQMLSIVFKQNACVRIYGKDDIVSPGTSDRIKDSLYLSDLSLIEANPEHAATPPAVVGAEPKHGWCYYFEKADLARQQNDWDQVRSLAGQVEQLGLSAEDASEYLLFIEGYIKGQNWDKASQLSTRAGTDPAVNRQICELWQRHAVELETNGQGKESWTNLSRQLECH